jgi:hypothetical protein
VGQKSTAEAKPEEVKAFCGSCHAYPPPDVFPRRLWPEEVRQGFHFFEDANMPLQPPRQQEVINYYVNRAPAELPLLPSTPLDPGPFAFERHGYSNPAAPTTPAVANVRLAHLADEHKLDVLVSDMLRGQIWALRPYEATPQFRLLSDAVSNPCHVEVVDLDGDGIKDLLVANLGSFPPTDEKTGSVVWLQGTADGTYIPHTLLKDVGRVTDVQAADFQGKGRLDLVVAVFGWRATGEVLYLENQTTDYRRPKFVPRVLDRRHGAIHVPVGDINGDGRPDIVALISQEHETVVAFLNEGNGRFTPQTIYTGPHPAYGSSGIQLVDLDGDGKLDVLYTNGDTLDRALLRPYHGIHWLRNEGTFPFKDHLLANMYGVHRALAADFRGCGKLDVVAVGFLPEPYYTRSREQHHPDAILMLEQTRPGVFVRRALEQTSCDHATCDVGDIDGDGRVQFVTGNLSLLGWLQKTGEVSAEVKPKHPESTDYIAVWKNVRPLQRRGRP